MSSINEVMEEEKNAQMVVKDAEQKAEAILSDAKATAAAMIRKAQGDDAAVKELTERHKERIAATRARILEECETRVAQTEKLYARNLEASVRLIVGDVLGVELEH